MTRTGKLLAATLLLLCGAASAANFTIKIDPREKPLAKAPSLDVPKGARAAADRYFKMTEKGHTVVLGSVATDEDGAELLELDKGVAYAVRATKQLNSFVLMMVNAGKEPKTVAVEIAGKRLLPPIYRRVFSADGGKTWDTIAWEPPQSPDLCPWTVELSPFTVQTVTIKTRKAN